ncbi:ABC transporter permease subunit [Kosakonia radicincitans]|uniref:ABC transporter permease subunit n=1 Tax=Kosakonia radicincitans TaxID=283686 RepID=UPI0005C2B02E|nr:ABC transporter permease subunit [Kosakonia radicincitans]KIS44590.1 amino ABC transporter, permease, 3-TM region, His/Glu/Gln/Arg/opine family domain protein [Kosakonia radicincitans YD4]
MNAQPLLSFDDLLFIVPKLLENLSVTLSITLASLLLGLALGLLAAVLQFSRAWLLRLLAKAYTDVLRGAPLALLILLFFFGGKLILSTLELPATLISDTTFAILSISVGISPYFAEMMRSAWNAVDIGQKEALRSLNIPWHIGVLRVIFPQGLIIAIPNFGNLLINLVKMTSLVNIIGIVDIFGRAQKISQNSYGAKQVAAFISVILIYWLLNIIIFYLTGRIEKKYQYLLE